MRRGRGLGSGGNETGAGRGIEKRRADGRVVVADRDVRDVYADVHVRARVDVHFGCGGQDAVTAVLGRVAELLAEDHFRDVDVGACDGLCVD